MRLIVPFRWILALAGALLLPILGACSGRATSSAPPLGGSTASAVMSFPVPARATFSSTLSRSSITGITADLYVLPPAVTNKQLDDWYAATLPSGHAWKGLVECVDDEKNSAQVLVEDGQTATLNRWWSDGQSRLGLVVIRHKASATINLTLTTGGMETC